MVRYVYANHLQSHPLQEENTLSPGTSRRIDHRARPHLHAQLPDTEFCEENAVLDRETAEKFRQNATNYHAQLPEWRQVHGAWARVPSRTESSGSW